MPVFRFQGPDARTFGLIMPVSVPGGSLQSWLALNFTQHFGTWFPRVSGASHRPVPGRTEALLTSFQFQDGAGRATLLVYRVGRAGMVFGIAAPAAQYASSKSTLVRIVSSFRFAAPVAAQSAAPGSAPSIAYTRFEDPKEKAFQVEVPQGWRIEGGTDRRYGTTAARLCVRMTSPDDRIVVNLDDPTIPPYIMPEGMVIPMRNGSMYTPGYGTQMMVMPFQHAIAYSEGYVRGPLSRLVGQVNVRDKQDYREFAQALSRQSSTSLAQMLYTVGEISFEGRRDGQPYLGSVSSRTVRTTMQSVSAGGVWTVEGPFYWVAPAGGVETAISVAGHFWKTFRISPQWFAASQRLTANVSAIVTETNNQVSRIISNSYWSRQRAQDRTNRNFSDYIRGVQRVRDPETGEEFEARAGSNYYWRLPSDSRPFGTDTTGIETVLDVRPLETVD
jgi:hypothetical protein